MVNVSQRKLNDNEISLLRKVLNFVKTPKSIPKKEILASVEQAISNLDKNTQCDVRATVYSILKEAKPPVKQNLTHGESKAIKELQTDNTIIITKADKGNSVAIMDKSKYHKQVNVVLQEQAVYTRIRGRKRNPTTKVEMESQNRLKNLKRSGNLTGKEYWRLRSFDSCPAMFYSSPKGHKVPLVRNDDHFTLDERLSGDIAVRPIYSNVDSPTYQLSKYLANLLKHILSTQCWYYKQW